MEEVIDNSSSVSGNKPGPKPDPTPVIPIIYPETKNTDICIPLAPIILKIGTRGQAVKVLQERLNENLFDPGIPDGIFGPMTDKAVKAFQKAKALDVDGIVGPITRGVLDLMCRVKSN